MNESYLPVLKRICDDVRRDMRNLSLGENEVEWDTNVEVLFFYAMLGFKPVGVNKHFMMLLIHNRFTTFLNHQLSSKVLWDHLDTMYDMPALHESEIIPFPNDEVDFELPDDCHELLKSKYGVSPKYFKSEGEPKLTASVKLTKKHGTPKCKQSNIPTTASKSNAVSTTPSLHKTHKYHHAIVKEELKAPTNYEDLKFKQEFGVTVKATKLKHTPAMLTSKYSKAEFSTGAKEESPAISQKKRMEKVYSTSVTKKPLKIESLMPSNVPKKPKAEGNGNGSKLVKTDVGVTSQKKVKDYLGRKGKVTPPIDNMYPKKKIENANIIKKSENVNVIKKRSDSNSTTPLKQAKSDFKTFSNPCKIPDVETQTSAVSRKSSPVVRAKVESSKKPSRGKSDEPVKKIAAVEHAKRERERASSEYAKKERERVAAEYAKKEKERAATEYAKKEKERTSTDSVKKSRRYLKKT